ncbi:MAG: porin [Hyphomicrobiales bacterium]|nr:porin [Hyphomicrobiales bacterium]
MSKPGVAIVTAFLTVLTLAQGAKAQAADHAKPKVKAAYMQACPGLGYGFVDIPETSTCLKLGLDIIYEMRTDLVHNDFSATPTQRLLGGVPVILPSVQNLWATADHVMPRLDIQMTTLAVTPTDFGPLVVFADGRNSVDVTLANDRLVQTPSSTFFLDQGWISWAGITAGHQQSYFDFTSPGYGYFGGYSSLRKTNLLAYSKAFNNIFRVSASLEDPTQRQQVDGVISGSGPQRWPDLVGQIRFAPKNALFQLSGALHQNIDTTANACCNAPVTSKEGYALLAGMELRAHWSDYFGPKFNGMYGRLMVTAAYSRGALAYLGMPFFATDYVADADGTIHLSSGYSALVSYEHLWTPFVKSTFTFSGYDARMSSGLANLAAVSPSVTAATGFTGGMFNFTYRVRGWGAQFGNEFTPANGLVFGSEVNYTHDQIRAIYAGVPGNPMAVNIWSGTVYVKRLF